MTFTAVLRNVTPPCDILLLAGCASHSISDQPELDMFSKLWASFMHVRCMPPFLFEALTCKNVSPSG